MFTRLVLTGRLRIRRISKISPKKICGMFDLKRCFFIIYNELRALELFNIPRGFRGGGVLPRPRAIGPAIRPIESQIQYY